MPFSLRPDHEKGRSGIKHFWEIGHFGKVYLDDSHAIGSVVHPGLSLLSDWVTPYLLEN